MKTKYYISLFIVLTLVLNACKKGSSGDVTPTVQKYLVQSVYKAQVGGIGLVTTTTDITYDNKKRKQTEKSDNITTIYAYYDNGKIYSINELFGDGKALSFYSEYTYTSNLLTQFKKITYKYNEDVNDAITNYIYNSSNQVIEEHYYIGYVITYTYDSHGDAVKKIDKQDDIIYTYVYTYDANHRFLTQTKSSSEAGSTPISIANTYDSHGNITKLVTTTGATTTTVNTTYVYDADGYMTSFTADNGSSATYTYSTL